MTGSRAPIFVLCCARSGSTLLRYILDTHPDITAPPELHLLLTARQLAWVVEHAAGDRTDGFDRRSSDALQTRELLDTIMVAHAKRAAKSIWAEKSVSSLDCLDTIEAIYPDARLIFLYRQAPDVMASCAQAAQRRQGTFGFEPFVARTPDNAVDGLADYWLDKNRRALEGETRLANAHLRLRYEDLVRDPQTTLVRLFGFLELPMPADMLDSIFTTQHVVGPGDSKILSTTRIHTDSIGHGNRLAMAALSADRRRELNALHARLGYAQIPEPERAR